MSKSMILAGIRSMIEINTFFECFEEVRFWEEQLHEAEVRI